MEGKKSSFVDELFPRKEVFSPANSDILSSIFPPRSSMTGNDSFLCESSAVMSRKLVSESRSSNPQGEASGGIFDVISSQSQNVPKKNGNTVVPCETSKPFHLSSSVYYGGRDDFIPGSSSSHNFGSTFNSKQDKEDYSNSDTATRGEWWHGSFYY